MFATSASENKLTLLLKLASIVGKQKSLTIILICSTIITVVFSTFLSPLNIGAQILAFAKLKISWEEQDIDFSSFVNIKFKNDFEVTLKSRLEQYQNELADIRWKFLYKVTNMSFVRSSKVVIHRPIIDEKQAPNYIATLLNQSKDVIYTLILNWTYHNIEDKKTNSVLPVNLYFKPFATLPVCNNFGAKFSKWKDKVTCNISEEKKQLQFALNVSILNSSIFENSVVSLRPFTVAKLDYYSYISLVQNVVINDLGNVISDDFIVLPDGCRPNANSKIKIPLYDELIVYDEIFVTTQYWGASYFHMTIENLPRLAAFIEFLRNHSSIRIHMSNDLSQTANKRAANHAAQSLAALGIDPKRMVYGTVIGRLVYLPRITPCGNGLLAEVQILAARYHNYISKYLNENQHSSVVLIIRQGAQNGRNMPRSVYDQIQTMLTKLLVNSRLKLETFDDKKRLSFSETLRLFYRARMVIGLHGAGLANVIYSRPGTVVIEMLCQPSSEVNPCYIHTAGILGHRYHAIPAYGCSNKNAYINITELEDTVTMFLNFLKHSVA